MQQEVSDRSDEERTDRILGQYIPCKFLPRQSLRLTEEVRRLIADTLKTG